MGVKFIDLCLFLIIIGITADAGRYSVKNRVAMSDLLGTNHFDYFLDGGGFAGQLPQIIPVNKNSKKGIRTQRVQEKNISWGARRKTILPKRKK